MYPLCADRGKESVMSGEEAIATYAGCRRANILCKQYMGLWLCGTSPWNCYRYREIIYANKQEEKGD